MDIDTRVLALIAEEEHIDDAHSSSSLSPADVWREDALVDAWSAACSDFRAYSLAASTASLPVLPGREQQLNSSPLWYAAPFRPPKASSSSSSKRPIQTIIDSVQEEEEQDYDDDDEQYEEDECEYDDEAGYVEASMDVNDPVAASHDAHPQTHTQTIPATTSASRTHATSFKIKHSKTGADSTMPYFDPAEWEPVNATGGTTSTSSASKPAAEINAAATAAMQSGAPVSLVSGLDMPSPPSPEHAIPQDPALADPNVTPEQALQNALNAWYTAGYAAALYHVRSGMVKP